MTDCGSGARFDGEYDITTFNRFEPLAVQSVESPVEDDIIKVGHNSPSTGIAISCKVTGTYIINNEDNALAHRCTNGPSCGISIVQPTSINKTSISDDENIGKSISTGNKNKTVFFLMENSIILTVLYHLVAS